MEFKENDFVRLEFDLYGNGELSSTTDKKKAEEAGIDQEEERVIILGKHRILKAIDNDIINNCSQLDEERTLELSPEEAFGKRKRELMNIFREELFRKNNIRPVVGGVYDFGDGVGVIKSINSGRIMVDFNHPLAGKDVKVVYKVKEKVEDSNEKLKILVEQVLKVPQDKYEYKDNTLKLSSELLQMKNSVKSEIEETIPELKGIEIRGFDEQENTENFKNKEEKNK